MAPIRLASSVLLMAPLMVSCAADGQVYRGGLVGQTVRGNEAMVSVSNVWKSIDALPLADKHCAKYGKVAEVLPSEGYTANFRCVQRTTPAA